MKKIIFVILLFVLVSISTSATELTKLIDIPTAGILQKGEVNFPIAIYKNGGVSFGSGVGIIRKLMFGIQYGGENIIGHSCPKWNKNPGVFVKYRIFDESPRMPALAVGFDSRGFGCYIEKDSTQTSDTSKVDVNRYEIKSKGFYLVLSENFDFLGNLGIHFGANYSTENNDNDDNLNFFMGFDKSINQQVGIFLEYDFAFNDNGKSNDDETYSFGEGNGYLNSAIYINLTNNILLKVIFRDILENQYKEPDRAITLQYSTKL